jgi:hypothetical protein
MDRKLPTDTASADHSLQVDPVVDIPYAAIDL